MAEFLDSLNEVITADAEPREARIDEMKSAIEENLKERLQNEGMLVSDAKHMLLRTWSANLIVGPTHPVFSLTFLAIMTSDRGTKFRKITVPLPGAEVLQHSVLRIFGWKMITTKWFYRLRCFLNLFRGLNATNAWQGVKDKTRKRLSMPALRKKNIGFIFGGADASFGLITLAELTNGIDMKV